MGSAMQASGDPAGIAQGMHIVLGGLIFQFVVFVLFVGMAGGFHAKLAREPTGVSMRVGVEGLWQRCMWALYVASGLVLVRNGFRIVEFADKSQRVAKTEALLYVFDAALMFLVAVVLAVVHPGRLTRAVRKLGGDLHDEDSEYVPLDGGRK
ncbi:RTA-like protein [Macrophomina phaseolina MS6]|uniref:RTA-like protein n=2 Tax=Macrophomina phaseolina TaxID=35725 RepID=K2S8M0_MACPH|nr:RTA-like protein [Macrophomina phaseolina MS6]